jgi:archaemetzincin
VQLILWPIPIQTDIDYDILDKLGKDISKEFENIKLTLDVHVELKRTIKLQSSINERTSQWNSLEILESLDKLTSSKEIRILGISNIDAYSDGFDFVFGEAYYKGRVAAIYLPRLRQEFYGLKPNPSLFYDRLVKEAIHELGHVFGFGHCKNSRCVMHFSNSLLDVDKKGKAFCHSCRIDSVDLS